MGVARLMLMVVMVCCSVQIGTAFSMAPCALTLLTLLSVAVERSAQEQGKSTLAMDMEGAVELRDEDKLILQGAVEGKTEKIQQALNLGAEIDARDDDVGNTPLIWAAFHGHYAAASFLIKRGAQVGALSRDSHKTALIMAAYSGHVSIISLLLEKGALINEANSRGDTPLAIAAYMNHTAAVLTLLDARASPSRRTIKHFYTPLHLAAYRGYTEVLAALLPHYSWETPSPEAEFEAFAAEAAGQIAAPDMNLRDKEGNSAMMLAAIQGQTDAVELLLEAGSDFTAVDKLGNTALMLAANKGHLTVVTLLAERLDAGAVIMSSVAKQVAARAGPRGASSAWLVDAPNLRNETPLGRSCAKGFTPIIKLLLMRGASLQAATMGGKSCREVATENGWNLTLALLDTYAASSEGSTIEL